MLHRCLSQDADTIAPVSDQANTATDEQLAAQAARGDHSAQAELVRRFQQPVLSLCFHLVGSQHAEDLAQDALLRVVTKIETFSGESAVGTWIYRVTTNICLSHLRRSRRSPVRGSIDAETSPQIEEHNEGSSVQMNEGLPAVRRALDELSGDQRAILVLRDVRGLEYEQLTEVLDIPIGTVRSRLFRARKNLAAALERIESNDSNPPSKTEP